jgi:hypothetical protein
MLPVSIVLLLTPLDGKIILEALSMGIIFLLFSMKLIKKLFNIIRKEKVCSIIIEAIITKITKSNIYIRDKKFSVKEYHISYLNTTGLIYNNDLNIERKLKVGDKIKIKYNSKDKNEFIAVDEF